MDIASQVEAENELRVMGSEQLRKERAEISHKLKSLQDEISDLAFNNYRTYADAGRTTQDCTEIFTEMSEKLREVSGEVGSLSTMLKDFHTQSKTVSEELETVKAASDKSSPLWDVLSLPSRMDVCIRSGYYEAAFSLTNYGMTMQRHAVVKNPLLKTIADRLVESRSLLLEELFNKFSGPLDLAASLQVVNNVRKMPYLSPTQLRVSVLQHKDMYLEKQILEIASHSDFAIVAIDVYRTCMHDTLVLYLSVFPENETVKKDSQPMFQTSIDPRWESWPTCAPSAILGQWALRNINRLLSLVHRAEMKQSRLSQPVSRFRMISFWQLPYLTPARIRENQLFRSGVDMASVWSKLMTLASTFGRMGLDFRPLVVESLTRLILDRLRTAVRQATSRLVNDVRVLTIASGELAGLDKLNFDYSGASTVVTPAGGAPTPSAEVSLWDDICVYGNDVIDALNALRYSHTPIMVDSVCEIVRDSLRSVVGWLEGHAASPLFPKAVRILCLHMAPFLTNCVRYLFPFSVVSKSFGTSITRQQYDSFTDLDMKQLVASADGAQKVEEMLLPLLQKKALADIDLDAVLRKENKDVENQDEAVVSPEKPDTVAAILDEPAVEESEVVIASTLTSSDIVIDTPSDQTTHSSVKSEQCYDGAEPDISSSIRIEDDSMDSCKREIENEDAHTTKGIAETGVLVGEKTTEESRTTDQNDQSMKTVEEVSADALENDVAEDAEGWGDDWNDNQEEELDEQQFAVNEQSTTQDNVGVVKKGAKND